LISNGSLARFGTNAMSFSFSDMIKNAKKLVTKLDERDGNAKDLIVKASNLKMITDQMIEVSV